MLYQYYTDFFIDIYWHYIDILRHSIDTTRHSLDITLTLFGHNTDFQRHYNDTIPMVYRHYNDTIPMLYRHYNHTIANLYCDCKLKGWWLCLECLFEPIVFFWFCMFFNLSNSMDYCEIMMSTLYWHSIDIILTFYWFFIDTIHTLFLFVLILHNFLISIQWYVYSRLVALYRHSNNVILISYQYNWIDFKKKRKRKCFKHISKHKVIYFLNLQHRESDQKVDLIF